jgi:hypothetical protein
MPSRPWDKHDDALLHRLVEAGVPWDEIKPHFPNRSMHALKSRICNERYLSPRKTPDELFAAAIGDARYTDNPAEVFKSRTRQPVQVGSFFAGRTLGGVTEYGARNG